MIERIDNSLFRSRFENYDRVGSSHNFTYRGLDVLFDYLEQLEEDIGTQIELDVIGICCEYSEDTLKGVLEDYDLETLDELEANTTVIKVTDDTIIYQCY